MYRWIKDIHQTNLEREYGENSEKNIQSNMVEAPTIICLKSVYNNKYLRYRFEEIETHGLLTFGADKVVDPYAQFEMEKSITFDGLFHIKCRYNNKYLVRWSPLHYWITASADKKDEKKGSWTCTLFKPFYLSNTNQMRLYHVQLGHYACLWRVGHPFDSCLFAGDKNIDRSGCDIFACVYWENLSKFPKCVAFMGDNGKYLGITLINEAPHLQFEYDNLNDPRIGHEILVNPSGILCIKSLYNKKFWRCTKNENNNSRPILAVSNDPRVNNNDTAAMFRLSVLDINEIALVEMSNTSLCKRNSLDMLQNCLMSVEEGVDPPAVLKVIELDMMSSEFMGSNNN